MNRTEKRNGAHTERVVDLDQVAQKTVVVEINDGPYEGIRATCAAGLTVGAYFDFTNEAGDTQLRLARFAREIILGWNIRSHGEPLPPDEEGIKAIPFELALLLLAKWNEALAGVPSPLDDESTAGGTLKAHSIPMAVLSEPLEK